MTKYEAFRKAREEQLAEGYLKIRLKNHESMWCKPVDEDKELYRLHNEPVLNPSLHFGDVVKAVPLAVNPEECVVWDGSAPIETSDE